MITEPEIRNAYRTCRKITAEHARTFYFASLFLPRRKRNACYGVYAFCRYVDDLVDEQVLHEERAAGNRATERVVLGWREELDKVYAGGETRLPIMVAWADILKRYRIPREFPDLLIAGCLSDLRTAVRFDTFGQLHEYCYNVASVVGLMTGRIFGYDDPEAETRAADLGIAMQLTNILRDIGEDFAAGRIYLPQEELCRFGLTQNDLQTGAVTKRFREFMRFQIRRARMYYESANAGIAMLESDSRMTVWLMSHNYSRILDAIERNNYDVFSQRAHVPLRRKLMSLPALWIRSLNGTRKKEEKGCDPGVEYENC